MMRLLFAAVLVPVGAATARASLPPPVMSPFLNPPPFARTYHVAPVLPLAGVAGGPPAMAVGSLRSIRVSEPGTGGPCGNPDRFWIPAAQATPERVATEPAAANGTPPWVPLAAGAALVGLLTMLGAWLLLRSRGE